MFVLLVVELLVALLMVAWKYMLKVDGELSVMIILISMMLKLLVVNWGTGELAVSILVPVTVKVDSQY